MVAKRRWNKNNTGPPKAIASLDAKNYIVSRRLDVELDDVNFHNDGTPIPCETRIRKGGWAGNSVTLECGHIKSRITALYVGSYRYCKHCKTLRQVRSIIC